MDKQAGPRILVVDDDQGKRYVIARHLKRAGYRVIEAATGAEALRLLQEPLDLLVERDPTLRPSSELLTPVAENAQVHDRVLDVELVVVVVVVSVEPEVSVGSPHPAAKRPPWPTAPPMSATRSRWPGCCARPWSSTSAACCSHSPACCTWY